MGHQDHWDQQDQKVVMVLLVLQVQEETSVLVASKVFKDHQDQMGHREIEVLQGTWVGQVDQVPLDLLDLKDTLEPKVPLDHQGLRVEQAILDSKVHRVLQELRDLQGLWVAQVLLVL